MKNFVEAPVKIIYDQYVDNINSIINRTQSLIHTYTHLFWLIIRASSLFKADIFKMWDWSSPVFKGVLLWENIFHIIYTKTEIRY